jgi:hypothetical protein
LSISFSGCIGNDDGEEINESNFPYFDYHYDIEIQTSLNVSWEIIVPLPLNENDKNISSIVYDLKSNEGINWEIIDTNYGKGLHIFGNNNTKLSTDGKNEIPYAWLSMYNSTFGIEKSFGEYWIFVNSSKEKDLSIYIKCWILKQQSEFEGKAYNSNVNARNLSNGWQKIRGDHVIERT